MSLNLDGTPNKRLFWSIINDYDVKTALTELVDNCFDHWHLMGRRRPLIVEIDLDYDRQVIVVKDNAGGVKKADLNVLITPGGSSNDPLGKSIGVFGVGSKRAVVALSEVVSIRTRNADEGIGYEIQITPEWLASSEWRLQAREVEDVGAGETVIYFSRLRRPVSHWQVSELIDHFGETYGKLLRTGQCTIFVNEHQVQPVEFSNWCFPPGQEPIYTILDLDMKDHPPVLVEICGGLIKDRDPSSENYGVYVYCNQRLVAKELKTKEVGYNVTGEAGRPHPDISLARVIVSFEGPARLMPWNSSKTGIVADSPVFQMATPKITEITTCYSKLSRALKMRWEEAVFAYPTGTVKEIQPDEAITSKKLALPPIPRVKKKRIEKLREANSKLLQEAPYVAGLLEAMAVVDVVTSQGFETGNRIALILLDSTVEIAFKEFMVHRRDLFDPKKVDNILGNRIDCIIYLKEKVSIPSSKLELIQHYYELRCKLIHERATVMVPDSDISILRETVEIVLHKLFGVRF